MFQHNAKCPLGPRNIAPARPFRAMDCDLNATLIHIEAKEAARRYGSNCFELRCLLNSWGDTLSDADILAMLRSLNRNGSIFAKVINYIPPENKHG